MTGVLSNLFNPGKILITISLYLGVSAQERMTEMAKEWKKTKDKK